MYTYIHTYIYMHIYIHIHPNSAVHCLPNVFAEVNPHRNVSSSDENSYRGASLIRKRPPP